MKIDLKIARQIQEVDGMFCRNCGETNPKKGFYPCFSYAVALPSSKFKSSLSGLICNRCDKKMRKKND